MPSDTPSISSVSCDAGTEAGAGVDAVKCDGDNEETSTSTGADSLPAAVAAEVDDSPSHHGTDADPQSALPADDTSSEPSSTDASPTHSDNAEAVSNSAASLPTDSETNLPPTDPVTADI